MQIQVIDRDIKADIDTDEDRDIKLDLATNIATDIDKDVHADIQIYRYKSIEIHASPKHCKLSNDPGHCTASIQT